METGMTEQNDRGFAALARVYEDIAREHGNPHVAGMCITIRTLITAVDDRKAMRWLGFVQGWLWSRGLRTIDEMRADVRVAIADERSALEERMPA